MLSNELELATDVEKGRLALGQIVTYLSSSVTPQPRYASHTLQWTLCQKT